MSFGEVFQVVAYGMASISLIVAGLYVAIVIVSVIAGLNR